jgi:hypothetical protein
MIERDHTKLSVRRQCALLAVNRNRLGPRAAKRTASDLELMRLIDALHTEFPFLGARKIVRELREDQASSGAWARGAVDAADGHRGAGAQALHEQGFGFPPKKWRRSEQCC